MNFKHSGGLGDIIYSLPVIQQKWKDTGERQALYCTLGVPASFYPLKYSSLKNMLFKIPEKINFEFSRRNKKEPFNLTFLYEKIYPRVFHPAKSVRMNQEGYEAIQPLILSQKYIAKVERSSKENIDMIDVDLDCFRNLSVNLKKGDIAEWHLQVTNTKSDLSNPWISYEVNESYKDTIVLGRSARYQNKEIDYSVLEKHADKILFVGLEPEYKDMKKDIPSLKYKKTNDALEIASIVGSCYLYIGNQSFIFAIAEGIKVRRILEECPFIKDVIPKNNGYIFSNQKEFETLLHTYIHS